VERGLVDVAAGLDPADAVLVDDLCEAAAHRDPVNQGFSEVHACHPRAVKALFDFAGHSLPKETKIINHRLPITQKSKTPSTQSFNPPLSPAPSLPLEEKAPAWYPVIDYDRCTNCGQCHQFCLFGVYEKDEAGKVTVRNPGSCKNNCPACARICPETAIIFPKVGESPINGAEITDEVAQKANVKVNVDEILGDDVYAALNARKVKRKSLLNKKKVEQALAERKRCSEKK
jgi:NAD-dependent dihydropyrimidine dehydrogenase PreA subunit